MEDVREIVVNTAKGQLSNHFFESIAFKVFPPDFEVECIACRIVIPEFFDVKAAVLLIPSKYNNSLSFNETDLEIKN